MLKVGGIVFVLASLAAGPGDPEPPDTTTTQAATRGPVVRISLEVVQVDAVVTDRDGRYVTDLLAQDFEILEDGKAQPVTLCSYVRTADDEPRTAATNAAVTRPLRRDVVRRTLAFVVDDLSLSIESTVRVRQLLRRFVDEQMQEGDLVAIVRTGAGLGSLQQFTTDRRLLLSAIERIRYNLAGRGPLRSAFALGPPSSGPAPAAAGGPSGAATAAFAQQVADFDRKTVQARQALLATGTLGALRYVMNGLATLPGRKSVVMLSEGMALYEEGRTASEIGSPFASTDLAVRLTCLFGHEAKAGYLRALVHMDAQGLTFAEEPDGGHRTILELVVMAFGADGRVVEQVAREHRLRIEPGFLGSARRGGIVYTADLPLKRAGGYQVRVAVRDAASGRLGSASQFVEVPDLRKDHLALSGIVMSGDDPPGEGGAPDPDATPAVRRFRRGSRASYAFFVYNPRVPRSPGPPQIETRVSVLSDGREILALSPRGVDGAVLTDPLRLAGGGQLLVASTLAPGTYTLQVAAVDRLRKGSAGLALQWMDFEVAE